MWSLFSTSWSPQLDILTKHAWFRLVISDSNTCLSSLCRSWLPDRFLHKLNGQWIVLGGWAKGLVCPQEGLTTQFYSVLIAKALPAMADFASKVFCRVGARTYEEDTAISCGRFSLTYYSLFRIFNSSQSKFLSFNSLKSSIRKFLKYWVFLHCQQ